MSCNNHQNKCGIPVVRDDDEGPKMSHGCKATPGGFSGPGIVPYELHVTNPTEEKAFQTGPVPINHRELQDTTGAFILDVAGLAILSV
jgi:hypothetical protein